jgi:hypothetical protein
VTDSEGEHRRRQWPRQDERVQAGAFDDLCRVAGEDLDLCRAS